MDRRKEKNPFYGKQHSEEVKKKISELQKRTARLKRMRGEPIGRPPRTTEDVNAAIEKQLQECYTIDEHGCWIWQGQFWHKRKYGRIRGHRKDSKYSDRAHVASYQYHKGETNGLYVCHTCDNPSCINPEHLWLGTNQENQLDAVRKGGRWKRKI